MFRYLLACLVLTATLSFSGCVLGPCGGGNCHDCDGASLHGGPVMGGPGQAFRAWRKGLTCGSGCGEVYYDEWSSTPPDCVDPCPEFAGGNCGRVAPACGCGVRGCRGGCGIRPLRAVGRLVVGLYGKRFCGDCGHGVGSCNCDDPYAQYGNGACCDGCGSGGTVIESGCATGNCGVASATSTQVASAAPVANGRHSMARQQMLTRQAMARATSNSRVQPAQPQVANSRPVAAPQKFYRNAQQSSGTSALRR